MGFHQLVQKLKRITPIISILQDKQNEWSFLCIWSTSSKFRTNNTIKTSKMNALVTLRCFTTVGSIFRISNKQIERSFYGLCPSSPKNICGSCMFIFKSSTVLLCIAFIQTKNETLIMFSNSNVQLHCDCVLFPGGGVVPYIGYTGMYRWKGYGFQAIWSGIGSSNHRKLV